MEKLRFILYSFRTYISANRIICIAMLALIFFAIVIFRKTEKTDNSTPIASENKNPLSVSGGYNTLLPAYSAIAFLLMLFPFTALLLMQFQNVFYSYEYLWTIVPIIPIVAYFLTIAPSMLSFKSRAQKIIMSAAITAVLLFCGSMGIDSWTRNEMPAILNPVSYDEATPLINRLNEIASIDYNDDLTILAPNNITQYVHYRGKIKTLYGKDMWDDRMAPYTYNNYPEDIKNLYTWICCCENYGTPYAFDEQFSCHSYEYTPEELEAYAKEGTVIGGSQYVELAKNKGVDIIVFFYADTGDFKTTDWELLNYLIDNSKLKNERLPLNDKSGYIIAYL